MVFAINYIRLIVMSFYININNNEAQNLLGDFQANVARNLGELQNINSIINWYYNSLFILNTTTDSFILKILESNIDSLSITSIEQKHLIQKFCHSRGMRVPEIVGELVDFRGRKAQLMIRVNGMSLKTIDPAQARILGRRTAEFQLGLQEIGDLCPTKRMNPIELLSGEVFDSLNSSTVSTTVSVRSSVVA